MKAVEPVIIRPEMTIDEMIRAFGNAGVFNAGKLADAVAIYDAVSYTHLTLPTKA